MNERFKEIRRHFGISQEDFAKSIGISGAAVSKIESGINNPADNTIRLVCATYHINYIWLTEGRGDMLMPMGTDELVEKYMPNETEFAKSIMKAFAKLPDADWEKLRDLIEKIKKEAVV